MSWGGLNPALTAWRNAYNRRLPGRGTASDGGYADPNHGSKSQHQPDSDGTVDANDMDVNVLGSSNSTGTDDELRIIEAMKLDFERDPHDRGHLWIHNREIAQHDEGWDEDYYGGTSPHTEHVHWESRQDHEDDGREWPMPETDRVLAEMGRGGDMGLPRKGDGPSEEVKEWQYRLNDLGYPFGDGAEYGPFDGEYGPKMENAVNQFRKDVANAAPASMITGWTASTMHKEVAKRYAGKAGPAGKDGKDGVDGKDGTLTGTFLITGGTVDAVAAPPE